MSNKKPAVRYITGNAIARFPRLNEPDMKFAKGDPTKGKYKVDLVLDNDEAIRLNEEIEKMMEPIRDGLYADIKKKPGQVPTIEKLTFEENEEYGDRWILRAQTAAYVKGEPRRLKLVDSKNKPTNVTVTGGSTIRAKVSIVPTASNFGVGYTCYLDAVQIVELNDGNGFDEIEGGYEDDGFEPVNTANNETNGDF